MSEITSDSLNRDIIRQRNAEIERLKAELEQSRRLCQAWIDKSARQDKLITELCDALAESDPFDRDIANSLIQRAREATSGIQATIFKFIWSPPVRVGSSHRKRARRMDVADPRLLPPAR